MAFRVFLAADTGDALLIKCWLDLLLKLFRELEILLGSHELCRLFAARKPDLQELAHPVVSRKLCV